ncbi:hypothetical protein DKAM_0793 [Desulfurococcus amylolyticus 1221n]|uniref:Uncharacterized protein n=1 Tax=Desulfurococcus amylolyticus (strain DSM 18924 / JCM 16383 / VKM B-2413 / 1221n) TaxID=490899 RepID=B8D4T8_DESA1|nr:hypothetical protein DKAM_0793 [Desulfurococcus amylolyticus 1221n]
MKACNHPLSSPIEVNERSNNEELKAVVVSGTASNSPLVA